MFVVAHGGTDLEHFEIQSFEEIRSILMQVTLTLAVAEESCNFEHRDLHWGNILISRDGTKEVTYRLRYVRYCAMHALPHFLNHALCAGELTSKFRLLELGLP